MDEADWAWPAWKFGMRRSDLFTTLHERYNTFSFALQDPEAFHHDVFEISRDADSPDQFHRLMADRQQQRLRELSQSLETLAIEIVGNPKLMGCEQWQYALQLFRTRSYDSMVRYFASYIPDHYLDRDEFQLSSSSSSCSSCPEADSVHTLSTSVSSADEAHCPLFLNDGLLPVVTAEPCSLENEVHQDSCSEDLGSPPRSDAAGSETCVSLSSNVDSGSLSSTNPSSRSASFSGSTSGHLVASLSRRAIRHQHARKTTRAAENPDATGSACDDVTESRCSESPFADDFDDEFPPAQYPDDQFDLVDSINLASDALDSHTPTPPRQDTASATGPSCSYMDHQPVAATAPFSAHQPSAPPRIRVACRETSSTARDVRRRSPEEALSRVQKPMAAALRKRPRGRRRPE